MIICIQNPFKENIVYNARSKKILYTTNHSKIMLYTTPFQRKCCIKRPVKENFACNTLSKQLFVCNCNGATPFKGKCCIRHPLKENFEYNSLSKKILYRPLKEFFVYNDLSQKILYTMTFQRKFCIQRSFKEIFVYNTISKTILYTTPFKTTRQWKTRFLNLTPPFTILYICAKQQASSLILWQACLSWLSMYNTLLFTLPLPQPPQLCLL